MSTVEEIERAIGNLKARELEELYSWLDRYHPQAIDVRLPNDLAAGHLDRAIQQALEDENAGLTRPL